MTLKEYWNGYGSGYQAELRELGIGVRPFQEFRLDEENQLRFADGDELVYACDGVAPTFEGLDDAELWARKQFPQYNVVVF